MPSAVVFGIIAMLAWAFWTVLASVATRTIDPEAAMILSYASAVAVGVLYVGLVKDASVTFLGRGTGVALVAGVFSAVAAVAFYMGLSVGRTAIVTTVSALYFVVAAVLGVLLFGESLDLRSVVGIGFAVASVLLLAR